MFKLQGWFVELEKVWPANSFSNRERFKNQFIFERTTDEFIFWQLPVSILQNNQILLAH